MSLKDEVAAISIVGGYSGKMDYIFAMLSPEDQDDLKELLGDQRIPARSIAIALSKRGADFVVSERTVQRYRQNLMGVK